MRLPLYRLLAVLLLLMMQGPALLVQEVAWVRMLVTYSQERGFARGVVETFDGEHPCPMCAKAAKLRQKERKQDPAGQLPIAFKRLAWMDAVVSKREWLLDPVPIDWISSGFVSPLMRPGCDAEAPVPPPPESVLI